MHVAAQRGNTAVLQELLGVTADWSLRNEDGNTPLHYCVRRSIPEEVLAVVVSRTGNVDVVNRGSETALFVAAWRDNAVAVRARSCAVVLLFFGVIGPGRWSCC